MTHATIPAPTREQLDNAETATAAAFERATTQQGAIDIIVAVQAQLQAEIQWLRSFHHPESGANFS
jgi:hypothetical protein